MVTTGSNSISYPAFKWENCKPGDSQRPEKDYIHSDSFSSHRILGYHYFAKIKKKAKLSVSL